MSILKESGISWIGMIPEHWELIRVKNIFKHHKNIVGEKEKEYERLALTLNGVLKRDKNDSKGLQSENLSTYQILNKNELVFKMIDLANVSTSRVGYSPYTGIVSPVYIILNNDNYAKFGYYYFYSMWQREIFNNLGNDGVRSALNASDMLNLPFPKISIEEAKKISDFLDKEIIEIDNAINKTKDTIDDYKKLKQSIIFNGVTKGIDYNRKFKKSGFEWIDNIPCEWKISKLKSVAKFKTGTTPSTSETKWFNGDYDWFTPGDFIDKYILKNSNRKLSIQAKIDNALTIIPANSTLLIGIGGTAGKIGYVEEECSCNQQITALIPHKVYPKYLMYWMIANTKYLKDTALYTTLPIINNDFLGNYLFIDPNDIEEEKKIVEYLDEKCNEIDKLIESKGKIVEELEQYKKSVIYEYVTGKKEVN